MNLTEFLSEEEKVVGQDFLENGYYIFPLDLRPRSVVDDIRKELFDFSRDFLSLPSSVTEDEFFNHTEKYVPVPQLNELKLKLMAVSSRDFKHHPALYHSAKKYLDYIIGNEVCMQRALNMSVQLPNDVSALLPLHSDVWSGNSPYEVVFWLPLVDCYKTKSMYVLPLKKSREVVANFKEYEKLDAEELYKKLEKDMAFVDVPKNHGVIFSHSILHGNRLNEEKETRWTFNIRFKAVMSPYGTKALGEAFIPVNLRPVTRIGAAHTLPVMG